MVVFTSCLFARTPVSSYTKPVQSPIKPIVFTGNSFSDPYLEFQFHLLRGDFQCPICKQTIRDLKHLGVSKNGTVLVDYGGVKGEFNRTRFIYMAEDLQLLCSEGCYDIYSITSLADLST